MLILTALVIVLTFLANMAQSALRATDASYARELIQYDLDTDAAKLLAKSPSIILFIGDGMGENHRIAARWVAVGMDGELAMDTMHFDGWARTASADQSVTDSAAAGTALATGVKTNNGIIGQDPDGNLLVTILERAKARGMSVGLVSNTQIAHATPASFAAHVPSRSMMTEIASQMLASEVDVMLGGGEDEFLPTTVTGCYPQSGERLDGRNLITEAIAAGYTYVCDASNFYTVDPASTDRLLGLFADEGMLRPFSPTLAEMTQKAIAILAKDPDGFFLMVEGGQIDWASHANDATHAITDTIAFDDAVVIAQAYAASVDNVQVIVTADHETGGMSVDLDSSGLSDEDGPFYMPDNTPFYVNWTTGGHTSADVPTTAQGPGESLLVGTYENTHVHDVMKRVLDTWFGISISGPTTGIVRESYAFTASVRPTTGTVTLPMTYTWQATGQSPMTDVTGLDSTVTFTWTNPGPQVITATTTNAIGLINRDTQVITVTAVPPKDLVIDGSPIGIVGSEYSFTATVAPPTVTLPLTYVWQATGLPELTIGGGTRETATFSWTTSGAKFITVTVSNLIAGVANTHSITVFAPVQADFTATPTFGVAPLEVIFYNTSIGDYTHSLWNFGDGVTSAQTNPSHMYATAGVYPVTLTISSPVNTDTKRVNRCVTVQEQYEIYLPLVLQESLLEG